MNISDELALSYYKPIADIRASHSVQLVQHSETGKFFVRKHLTVYHLDIYKSLQACPVRNIPKIELLVEDETGLTVIEEFIQGDTLQNILEQTGSLSEGQAVNYVIQLCHIVSDLHHRDPAIIHRDIKPSNIIVSPDGIIKLLDLNAAKYAAPSQSRDTTLLGTAGFAAPEQYGFAPSGVQSDLYAIGVLLNLLVTGKMPTEKKATGSLEPIIQKCIELDPANRYASADDFILALTLIEENNLILPGSHNKSGLQRYLPPGFRSGSVIHMILAVLGYALIIFIGLCIDVENATPLILTLNRATVMLIGFSIVLFTANYCDIQSCLPLTNSKHPAIRAIAVLLYDVVIVFALMIVLVLIESLI